MALLTTVVAAASCHAPRAETPVITEGGPLCLGPAVALPELCGANLAPVSVSCAQPTDVQGGLAQPNPIVVQRAVDLFAWQTFLALSWPSSTSEPGVPDPGLPLGAPTPTVWERWMDVHDVFHAAGNVPLPPLPWGTSGPLPPGCTSSRVLRFTSKSAHMEGDDQQPTGADATLPITLTDQKRHVTRYEIRLNQVAYRAITEGTWWSADAQRKLDATQFPPGSILVKAAWLPIAEADQERFQSMTACVCDVDDKGVCKTAYHDERMGLVGFHVMSKTASAPQWIWSTFEQAGNVEPEEGSPPTFRDPACTGCKENVQTPAHVPNQIMRRTPIPDKDPDCDHPVPQALDNVQALNQAVDGALAGTPYAHYRLVNAQWPLPAQSTMPQPTTVFTVNPPILANTTLESFIQGSSSCMGCHAMARTARNDRFVSSDFTFVLGLAAPKLPDPNVIAGPSCQPPERGAPCPPPGATACRGRALADHTYECLPGNVGAKLHCTSCHLDAGRDVNASWWVGMFTKYDCVSGPGPAAPSEAGFTCPPGTHYDPTGLQARINQCFERSMNGKPLCDVGTGCAESQDMQAILTYMSFLDRTWNATQKPPMPAAPYPPISGGTGDEARGEATFLQKCAFCHGVDGHGRYAHDTYFRPALWGGCSFRKDAGMGKPESFAAFVHGNMPFHAGGELTAQEAWDLSAFVLSNKHPHPDKMPVGRCDAGEVSP
ncbi:Cytochrome c family protein [Minicystis rosea]|nr:Cytochrome c family protein [Minicystis rosea]